MMSLELNINELRKKNFEEIAEIFEKMLNEVDKFVGVTKAQVIVMLAEKLEEAGYPILEIREKIQERFGPRITRPYLSSVLPDRFKNPKKIAAGKQTRENAAAKKALTNSGSAGSATMMEEPEQDLGEDGTNGNEYAETKRSLQRDELPDIKPKLESESEETTLNTAENLGYSQEYIVSLKQQIRDLEQRIKALGGELPYPEMQESHRVVKLDKFNLNRLYNASAASKVYTYLTIDIRTNQVAAVTTDTEWNKQQKQASKKPKTEDHTKNLKG